MFFSQNKKKKTPDNPIEQFAGGSVAIKDLIAPSFIEVDFNHLKIEDKYYKTLFVVGYPRFVQSNWLHQLISYDHPLYVSFFIYPTESGDMLKQIKRKITEMEATIEGDIRSGKVGDPAVQVSLNDALTIQSELAQGSERFFQFGLYITIPADSLEELESVTKSVDSLLSSLLIVAKKATLEMEEGFKSTLPLFTDRLAVWRNMDTTSLAMAFPFSTASLTDTKGILYGVNQLDGSLILFDRFRLESANSVVLGKSGGGKSFMIKLETIRTLLLGTDVIIIDPENEYENIVESVGGEFVSFSQNSDFRINPFDLNSVNPDADELSNKILSLHSLLKVIAGDLTPTQDAIIDKAIVLAYKQKGITDDPSTFTLPPPLLEDVYKILLGYETVEGQEIAYRLEKFIKGSASSIFNSQSNFKINNPYTVFGIRDLEENLRPVAMYIVLNYIWNLIRTDKRKRILVVDEAWYLIKHKDSADYLYDFAKRARKYDLGLTTATQDVEDFLSTQQGRAILTNSSLQILLKQSPAAIELLSSTFNLTSGEKQLLLSSGVGEGLFFAGQNHVAIQVVASAEEKATIDSK